MHGTDNTRQAFMLKWKKVEVFSGNIKRYQHCMLKDSHTVTNKKQEVTESLTFFH